MMMVRGLIAMLCEINTHDAGNPRDITAVMLPAFPSTSISNITSSE